MFQLKGSHKNSLNLLGEKYLNESHWPMCQVRLLECTHLLKLESGNGARQTGTPTVRRLYQTDNSKITAGLTAWKIYEFLATVFG